MSQVLGTPSLASGKAELTEAPGPGSLVRERPGGADALIRSALSSGFMAPGRLFERVFCSVLRSPEIVQSHRSLCLQGQARGCGAGVPIVRRETLRPGQGRSAAAVQGGRTGGASGRSPDCGPSSGICLCACGVCLPGD